MYNFIQQAYNQPDLSDAMKSLAKLIYKLEFIQNRIAKSEELRKNPEIKKIDLTCNQILDKHLPELMDEYCKLSVKYRNEISVREKKTREGMKPLTSKDILLADLSHLLEESDILEKSLNDNTNHDFLAKSSFITESFGIQPKILLQGDEAEKKISLENEFDSGEYQDMEMQEFFSEFFKKYPEKKVQAKPVIKSRALEEEKKPEIKKSEDMSAFSSSGIVESTNTSSVNDTPVLVPSSSLESNDNLVIIGVGIAAAIIPALIIVAMCMSNDSSTDVSSFQKITPIPHITHIVKNLPAPVPQVLAPALPKFDASMNLADQATQIANNMDKTMKELEMKYKGDYSEVVSRPIPSPIAYIDGSPSYMSANRNWTATNMTISQMRIEPVNPQTVSVSMLNIPQKVCMQTAKDLQAMDGDNYTILATCNTPDYNSVKIINNQNHGMGSSLTQINKIKIGGE
jgi:hypothetical protein